MCGLVLVLFLVKCRHLHKHLLNHQSVTQQIKSQNTRTQNKPINLFFIFEQQCATVYLLPEEIEERWSIYHWEHDDKLHLWVVEGLLRNYPTHHHCHQGQLRTIISDFSPILESQLSHQEHLYLLSCQSPFTMPLIPEPLYFYLHHMLIYTAVCLNAIHSCHWIHVYVFTVPFVPSFSFTLHSVVLQCHEYHSIISLYSCLLIYHAICTALLLAIQPHFFLSLHYTVPLNANLLSAHVAFCRDLWFLLKTPFKTLLVSVLAMIKMTLG